MSIGEKRSWVGGQRVKKILAGAHQYRGLLLAPIWSQFAWVCWDGEANPTTELACNLQEVPTYPCVNCGKDMGIPNPSGVCSAKCKRQAENVDSSYRDLVASGGIVNSPETDQMVR